MKRILLAAAAVGVFGASACDRGDDLTDEAPDTAAQTPPVVVPPAAGPEGVDFTYAADNTPEGFVQRMAMSDMYEIEASRVALERTQSPQIREFAQMMIDAHTATSREVSAAVADQKLAVTLPAALDPAHQRMVNELRGAAGEEFDQRYLDQQTRGHQEALDELEDYAEGGTNAALKAWAVKMQTAVRQHLDRARTLDRGGADGSTTPGADAATTTEPR